MAIIRLSILVLTLVCIGSCHEVVSGSTIDKVFKSLRSLPEEDRVEILRVNLIRGYELLNSHLNGEKNNELSDWEAKVVYNYFRTKNTMRENEFTKTVRKVICFPDGRCINIDDPGVFPK